MKYVLAGHVIFVVCWFAGLFYLPRLFVYHANATDSVSIERFKIMERKLFWGIMTPAAFLAAFLGYWYLDTYRPVYIHAGWMHVKLILVLLLGVFHAYCWKLLRDFKYDRNPHTHQFYRWINEIPTVLLIAIVILVIVKP